MSTVQGVSLGLTAAGTTAATSLLLADNTTYYQVSTCAASAGVRLPLPVTGKICTITNNGVASCAIWTNNAGGAFDGGTAGASLPLPVGSTISLQCADGLNWRTIADANRISGNRPVVALTTTTTVTAAQAGSILNFTKATAYTVTMPSPVTVPGQDFIICQNAAGAANTVVFDFGAGLLLGGWVNTVAGALTGATTAGTAVRQINFLTGASVLGDHARVFSNGTYWILDSFVGAAAAVSLS